MIADGRLLALDLGSPERVVDLAVALVASRLSS